MRTHFTDRTSVANSFLLLVMVAGVLNIELFEGDAVAGYHDHRDLCRTELVFNPEYTSQPSVLSISEDIPGSDVGEDRILPSQFYATCFGSALFVTPTAGQINTRPFYSSHNHTSSFNIPHQNSDEEEAFILSVDVA